MLKFLYKSKNFNTVVKNRKKPVLKIQWNLINFGKKNFQMNPFYFRIFEDFEADNETDTSNRGKRTINIYKPNPIPNSYYIVSELDDA